MRLLPYIMIVLFSLVIAQMSLASEEISIYDGKVSWNDVKNRNELLSETAEWDNDTLNKIFFAYTHPEQFDLSADHELFDTQFINALWGPTNNPFNKYPRPSKIFIFTGNQSDQYHMVLLIKNKTDSNYYVLDKHQARPMLLDEWIAQINTPQNFTGFSFNICNSYGVSPRGICDTNYQTEVKQSEAKTRLPHVFKKSPVSLSAKRNKNEDWRVKANNTRSRTTLTSSDDEEILSGSVYWKNINARNRLLQSTPSWNNYETIKINFEKIRDLRYTEDEHKAGFLRRITWLFPDDGCWIRASAAIHDLFGPFNNIVKQDIRPAKIFAFGNLCVNTNNESTGSVSWWYHTAPIIKDAQTQKVYVLDPAVNPFEPMLVEEWIAVIGSNDGACQQSQSGVAQFNICNGYGSSPFNGCHSDFHNEISDVSVQSIYRNYERKRQTNLGRDADAVLGELPPWRPGP